MRKMPLILLVLTVISFGHLAAQDGGNDPYVTVTTRNDKQYSNVHYRLQDNGILLFNSNGSTVVPYDQLSDDLSEFPKEVQDVIRAKLPPPSIPVPDESTISFTMKNGTKLTGVSYALGSNGLIVHTHSSGDVTFVYDTIDLSTLPLDIQKRIDALVHPQAAAPQPPAAQNVPASATPAEPTASTTPSMDNLPFGIAITVNTMPQVTQVSDDPSAELQLQPLRVGARIRPVGISNGNFVVQLHGTLVLHSQLSAGLGDFNRPVHFVNKKRPWNGTGLIPIENTNYSQLMAQQAERQKQHYAFAPAQPTPQVSPSGYPSVAQTAPVPTDAPASATSSGPDPDFLKPNTVFKPLAQVFDSLKGSGFIFEAKDSADSAAPDSVPVTASIGKTRDLKWIVLVYHLDQEVVRVMVCQGYATGHIPGAAGAVSINAIRPSTNDVKYAVDHLNAQLLDALTPADTDNITTFYKTYVSAQRVRMLMPHGSQGLLEVTAASDAGADEAIWGIQVSSFKAAYAVPTVHTDDGTSLTSVWINEGNTNWFLTADGGDTDLLHSVRSMHYYSAEDQNLAGQLGQSLPSQSMETTVDKIVLDQSGLKNFCDAAKKWFEANKPNAPDPSSTDLNDNFSLYAGIQDTSKGKYELMYMDHSNSFSSGNSVFIESADTPEIQFLLWPCLQPDFTARQEGIHAVYAKWQSFLEYKVNSSSPTPSP